MKKLILLAFAIISNIFAGDGWWLSSMCIYYYGKPLPLSECIKHYDSECKAKKYDKCYSLGHFFKEQKQYSQAKKYFEMVCDRAANNDDTFEIKLRDGEASAMELMQNSCSSLAYLYSTGGYGIKKSPEKSLYYTKKSCDWGSGSKCFLVGLSYEYGLDNVKKDLKTTIAFYAKSCKLEYGVACIRLGEIYRYVEQLELYGKACDLGFQTGCDKYKELKEKGY